MLTLIVFVCIRGEARIPQNHVPRAPPTCLLRAKQAQIVDNSTRGDCSRRAIKFCLVQVQTGLR